MNDTYEWLMAYNFWPAVVASVVGLFCLWLARRRSRKRDAGSRPAGATAPVSGWRVRAVLGWLSPRRHPFLASVVWAAVLALVFSLGGGWGLNGGWPAVRPEYLGSTTLPPWLAVSAWALIGSVWSVLGVYLGPIVLKIAVRVLS